MDHRLRSIITFAQDNGSFFIDEDDWLNFRSNEYVYWIRAHMETSYAIFSCDRFHSKCCRVSDRQLKQPTAVISENATPYSQIKKNTHTSAWDTYLSLNNIKLMRSFDCRHHLSFSGVIDIVESDRDRAAECEWITLLARCAGWSSNEVKQIESDKFDFTAELQFVFHVYRYNQRVESHTYG